MTRFELENDLRQRQPLDVEQQQGVIQEIRGFADDLEVRLRDAREREFQPFLADLLCDPQGSLGQKLGRVAARRTRGDALRDDPLEPAQERQPLRGGAGRFPAPTRGRAQMTGGPAGFGHDQQRVAVAIGGDLLQLEEIPGAFALGPEAPLAAAPKGDAAARLGRGERLPIHVPQHQNRAAAGVLNDGRQQAAALVPVQSLHHSRTSMPALRSRRFKRGMGISPE